MAYYALEPWGSKPDDLRAALVAHTCHASMGGKQSFNSFVPRWDRPKPLSYKQGCELMAVWAEQHNNRVKPT